MLNKEILRRLELSLCKSTSNGSCIPRGGWPGLSVPPKSPLYPGGCSPWADVHDAWHHGSPGASSTLAAKGSCLRRPTLLRAPVRDPVESKSPGCQAVLLVTLPPNPRASLQWAVPPPLPLVLCARAYCRCIDVREGLCEGRARPELDRSTVLAGHQGLCQGWNVATALISWS